MSAKNLLRSWLTFSRKDRIGAGVLLSVLTFVYFLPRLFPSTPTPPRPLSAAERSALDSLESRLPAEVPREGRTYPERHPDPPAQPARQAQRFPFDPNTLDEEGWRRLGLRARTAATIVKYRSKGGRFRRPEDLQRIWGLPPGFYEGVKDWIRLPGSGDPPSASGNRPAAERPKQPPRTLLLNHSDSADWVALPGIGPALTRRILAFRQKLGGFHSVEQVGETYGLPDSTFGRIRPFLQADAGSIQKLCVNRATVEELKDHPYIRWNLARAIVNYRGQHGAFRSLEELKNIALINEPLFQKLLPYLRLE